MPQTIPITVSVIYRKREITRLGSSIVRGQFIRTARFRYYQNTHRTREKYVLQMTCLSYERFQERMPRHKSQIIRSGLGGSSVACPRLS